MKEFGLRVGWSVSSEQRGYESRRESWLFSGSAIANASAPIGHLPTTYHLGGGRVVARETYEPHPDDAVMGFLGDSYIQTKREEGYLVGAVLLMYFFRRIAEIQ